MGEESLNAHTLQNELRQIAERAGPETSILIQNYMAATIKPALAIACQPLAQSGSPLCDHGRFGGAPQLPPDFDWPMDRAAAPMLFIAQFDLGRLPFIDVKWPHQGLLSIFRSAEILTMPAKDRRSFHISYLPQFDYAQLQTLQGPAIGNLLALPAWAAQATACQTVSEELQALGSQLPTDCPVTVEELSDWAQKCNRFCCGNNLFLAADLHGLTEQKEVCAFAASGITHSPTRARDRHYSHLIDDAANWMLLAKFDDAQLFHAKVAQAQEVSETRILIKREDLELGLFERAWLICLNRYRSAVGP